MAEFALVHGAWHGAWCWERLIPRLEDRGHHAVAMDLPAHDPDATFDTYADVVCESLSEAGEDIVLVGHSLAGLTIPLVAARRPVRHLVYVCALVPDPGRSLVEQIRDDQMLDPRYLDGMSELDAQQCRQWVDEDVAREVLFADCDDDVAHAAFERLTPQAITPYSLACSLDELPDVPSTYIVGTADRLVKPEWSRRVARERLGANRIEMPSGHSPFLSRVEQLAEALHQCAS